MKIFYAVQATGNGHISRAIELLPFLQEYGAVDIFLSGSNSNLQEGLPVVFRSKGISLFYGKNGGLDYWKMLKEFSLIRVIKEAFTLPIHQYDIVINDFECITALACWFRAIPSINFGHQASFISDKTPRPKKREIAGEFILKKYATAKAYLGLHFEQYDDFIYPPIIKADIIHAIPSNKGYITVYLPHYDDSIVIEQLFKLPQFSFEVFSKKEKLLIKKNNVTIIPVNNQAFNTSMVHCAGVITGAGFETPAECLYLGKKLLCIPIKGQYEQLCNAESLKAFNVPIIDAITPDFPSIILNWMNNTNQEKLVLHYSTSQIVEIMINKALSLKPNK